MDFRFILTISEHRVLGLVFAPYLVRKERLKEYSTIYDRVSTLNLHTYLALLSPEELLLVKLIEEYNEATLTKVFSKKKLSPREFMASIPVKLLEEQVRPYIERRMAQCLDILAYNQVPVYHKVLQTNIYEQDRIKEVIDESSTLFNFIRSEEGIRYFLSIEHNGTELKLTGKDCLILTNEPGCVVIGNRMFIFRDIDAKKLKPFFDKHFISIAKSAEKLYFESFVRNAIKKYKVRAEGFTILNSDAKPTSVISVERDLAGKFFISLKFIYDKRNIYYANRKTEQKVTCEFVDNEVIFTCLQRDYEFENESIAGLLSLGLVNKDGPYFQPLIKGLDTDTSGYQVINWINFNSNQLRNAGFSVAQDRLEKLYYLDDFILKMKVSEKNSDWFDIDSSVEFAGFHIPFSAFHSNILSRNREFILPDGRIMILPEEWFESYRDLLSFSKIENETIRLDKQHFSLLNRSAKGISLNFKENLLKLVDSGGLLEKVPENIEAELRNYQTEGYSWIYRLYQNGFGGCLADDMGLGKTLQTLVALQRIISEQSESSKSILLKPTVQEQLTIFDTPPVSIRLGRKPSLLVVPTSLVHNWMNEARKFAPSMRIGLYIGGQRTDLLTLTEQCDIILTSYGILRNDMDEFAKTEFLYLILDESQTIKNPGSKTYQSVMQIRSDYRLALSGTPIENSLTDLWAQINFLNPGLLGSLNFFRSEFQYPIEKNSDDVKRKKLQQLIAPFVMRRSKSEVATELPPVTEQIIYCNLDEQQEAYYEREKSKARNLMLDKITQHGYGKNAVIILQSLTRLRQIANHPALIDESYFAGSGKFDEITRNLDNLHAEGHKTLVFSSFVKHLELIANHLDKQGARYAWLTGETTDREKEIRKFQKGKNCPFFLISLKAGGVGLNLTAADYVFILDPWWNPAAEIQAISRAHRIGQDKHIFVYRFITRNTLEEKISKLQERKADLADAFINDKIQNITQAEVMELFD